MDVDGGKRTVQVFSLSISERYGAASSFVYAFFWPTACVAQ